MDKDCVNPFVAILGPALDNVAPAVRAHLTQSAGTRRYRGTLRALWRRGGWPGRIVAAAFRLASWSEIIKPLDSPNLPFEMENRIVTRPDGTTAMIWQRTIYFRQGARRFVGEIVLAPGRNSLVDEHGLLQVELLPRVVGGTVTMDSGRQWLVLGRLRLRLPHRLSGPAAIREWAEPDGRIGLRLSISNPLLGDYLGYEAILELDKDQS